MIRFDAHDLRSLRYEFDWKLSDPFLFIGPLDDFLRILVIGLAEDHSAFSVHGNLDHHRGGREFDLVVVEENGGTAWGGVQEDAAFKRDKLGPITCTDFVQIDILFSVELQLECDRALVGRDICWRREIAWRVAIIDFRARGIAVNQDLPDILTVSAGF